MLKILAGPAIYDRIRDEGLRPEAISAIFGAAGGPKWLVLNGIDKWLFGEWLEKRSQPLPLVGASIGSWRFACAACKDPVAAIERFENGYIEQAYAQKPGPAEISAKSRSIVQQFLGNAGTQEILGHKFLRLNLLADRARGLLAAESKLLQLPAAIAAMKCNLVHRSLLRLFFERALFHHPQYAPGFLPADGFKTQFVPLQNENLEDALMASAAIPLLMHGVRDIAGARPGIYRDGGMLDYHIDMPAPEDGIVLFPHYSDRIIPGWLDKNLSWRKPKYFHNTLLVAPSDAFLQRLPDQRIPDRSDFKRYFGRDAERIRRWRSVVEASRLFAEGFAESLASGSIRKQAVLMQP